MPHLANSLLIVSFLKAFVVSIGSLLKETYHGVATEPMLLPIMSETFRATTVNKPDGARLDIIANGFWGGAFESPLESPLLFSLHQRESNQQGVLSLVPKP